MKRLMMLVAAVAAGSVFGSGLKTSLLVHPDEFTDRWVDRAVALGLDNLSMHPVGGGGAADSLASLLRDLEKPEFRARIDRAKARGIDVGYEMHAASWLLPRALFKEHPEYFRMDANGKRCEKVNFCVSCPEAMDIVAKRAVELAGKLYGCGHRYFFWLDDVNGGGCKCEKCRGYSDSDQQLLFANRVVTELRKTIPDAELCYLAYAGAIKAPEKVEPAPGIFLEYAPIARDMGRPLAEQKNDQIKPLGALIKKFGTKGSRVLEYWFDNSLFSRWTKPPRPFRPAADVVANDIEYYRRLGFEEISSFACYLGDDYEKLWGEPDVSAFARAKVDSGCRVQSLDGDAWEFCRAGRKWTQVRVPHDWAIEGPFDDACDHCTGKLPWVGKGEYRRHFTWRRTGASGERAYLEFDGVMARPRVKVNGRDAGGWDYGYASFTLDVTALVKDGDNLLEVTADTTDHKSRWYPGAGIYRSVRLVTRGEGHAKPGSVFITTPRVTKEEATVEVRWETLKGPETRTFTVAKPRLWDVDDPHLYAYDIAGERFRYGIRTMSVSTNGLELNGRRLQVKGVCLHADLGLLGMAFDRDAMKRQLLCMKDMGVNAVRTSHNCPAPQLLDLCDELGLVVWDEAFDKWEGTSGRKTDENLEEYVIRNLKNFVRRDRNHPCVFTYSIGNEIGHAKDKANTGTSRARCDLFRKAILEEDATRPVGMGCCFTDSVGFGDLDGLDLTGWNYKETYQPMHRRNPLKPLFYSESASAFSDYGYYPQPFAGNGDRTEDWFRFDVKTWKITGYDHLAATWSDIADMEFMRMERDRYVGGEFVWTGIDYLGEPTPFTTGFLNAGVWSNRYERAYGRKLPVSEMARSSYFGIADLCVIPKDRWYLYRAHWNGKAETVHVLPHWNWGKGRETGDARPVVPVYVYTSGDEAELFLNGKSLGRRRKDAPAEHPASFTNTYYDVCAKYRLRWFDVPYEPGELKAVAYRGGKAVGEETVRTAGEPVAVKLTRDPYSAEGADLVFVQVDVTDAKGVRSPTSMARFEVRIEGPGEIAAVGNSNPRSMVSFRSPHDHTLWFGKAVVAVRRFRGTGAAPKLTVSVEGLKSATLEIGGK